MNYEEEIRYRKKILSKVRNGEKITPEDRLWGATHRIYNRYLGYPYLNTDIIQLLPKTNYCVRVKIESLTYPGRVLPVITVPGGKGRIITSYPLTGPKGNVQPGKPIKMLGVLIDLHHKEAEFTYQSDLGLLGVSFECEYFDHKQHLMIRKNSNAGDPNYAMRKEVLTENNVRYWCKTPDADSFEGFVFTLEWQDAAKK